MNIDSISVYVGPNVHALEPVIRLKLDVKPSYAETLQDLGAGVIDRVAEVLPGLATEQTEWHAALRAGGAVHRRSGRKAGAGASARSRYRRHIGMVGADR